MANNFFKKANQTPSSHTPTSHTHTPQPYAQSEPSPAPTSSYTPVAEPTFQAAPSRPATASTRNVLSSDVEIKGTVKFSNDLLVDGKIEGQITSDGNLTVGENANLKTEIKTGNVTVYGKVHGNITAVNSVELKSTAEVVGDIKAKTLAIEAGAIFIGKSTVGTPANTPATRTSESTPTQGTLSGTGA